MKIQFIPTFFTIAALAVSAHADVLVMKDGTKIEGEVLREDADVYVVEVYVTKTIKDQKRVPKADVSRIDKDRPDEKAFEEIKPLVPTPDMLPLDQYKERILLIETFIKQYPNTSNAKKAEEMLQTLKTEVAQINEGGVKLNDKMVTPAEYRANAYEIDARVLEQKTRDAAKAGDYTGALEAFNELQNDYEGTAAYKDVAPFARKLIDVYRGKVSQLVSNFDARLAQQKKGLASMGVGDRGNAERAIADEAARAQKLYQREKAQKKVWVTPSLNNKTALQDIQRTADKELATIDRKSKSLKADGGEAYRNAWEIIHKDGADPKEVKAAVAIARAARMPERYTKMLEDAAKERNIEL